MQYNFEFIGGKNNSYVIVTKSDVVYEIKFKPSSYLSNLNFLDNNLIFEFVIEVLYKPENIALTLDKFLAPTINIIFIDFYDSKNNGITVYICDSSDGKQWVRKRKFDQWFEAFKDSSFVKFDDVLIDKEENEFPISFILKNDNPSFIQIYKDFYKKCETK
ncbi:intracellular sulfur oxidation DsrE/DsrF family protein [Flavobacterium sp. PL11]|uniref:DUF6169 family protein n=1 Tax=Flavobacterium sp. PL11 TaxID=3071717 RepID=UPI002E0CBB29|nr:intracellular sulfur oxidation DsrE/DsrF family protein [Flavobacterium sp. PL11]